MNKQQIINNLSGRLGATFFQQLAQYPLPPYRVVTWSRDCDMCESTRVRTYMSYISLIQSYASYIENLEDAEGPSSWNLVDPNEYPEDGSHSRDRAMEAFENGNGRSIYV